MKQKGITKEWVQAVHPAKGGESKTADGVSFVESRRRKGLAKAKPMHRVEQGRCILA